MQQHIIRIATIRNVWFTHHKDQSKHRHNHHAEYAMVYSDKIEDKIDLIMDALKNKLSKLKITVGMLLGYWKWIEITRVTLFILPDVS